MLCTAWASPPLQSSPKDYSCLPTRKPIRATRSTQGPPTPSLKHGRLMDALCNAIHPTNEIMGFLAPLLRVHPHPSLRRSIGQTIGVTAYQPQRTTIFKTPAHSSLPRRISVESLIRAVGSSQPHVALPSPVRLYHSTPAGPEHGASRKFDSQLAYSMTKVGSLRSPSCGQ